MLAPAYLVLDQPYQETKAKPMIGLLQQEEEDLVKSNLMAQGQENVFKQMEVKDLGSFTAFTNRAIKAVF